MKKFEVTPEVIRVLKLEAQAILNCADRMSTKEAAGKLEKAITFFQKSLEQGGKIVVMGVGKSGKVGQKIAATLCSTGSLAIFLHPTEGLHGDLGVIRPNDSILALSYTGNTEELICLLPSLRKLGVPVIGIGGNTSSKLAEGSNVWLDAHVDSEACPHNLAPTTSTTLALALGDAIAVALMRVRGFDAQSFAEYHPGGSLGKRLNLKVADLMHKGSAVPTVGPKTQMEKVVVESTQKPLGAVLVVEGSRLLGIITDGDIRRALEHREKFFQLTAAEVMTQNPVTIQSQMMANTALQLMEDRPSQISVIPVVNEAGCWEGLIRLHDLVRTF